MSGTFTGGRSGTQPWLTLAWRVTETDIAGNRSKVELTLRLHSEFSMNFSSSQSGVLQGSSFTYTGGMSGAGSVIVRQREVWVSHDSNGAKTETFSGSLNLQISWGGSTVGNLTVSGNASLPTIPRASDLTAFSLSNTTINTSTANTVTYTINRKSTSFSHNMELRLGSSVIKSWSDSGTGSRTQSLTAAEVNSIINLMPNTASATLTLRLQTRSGSTNIGSVQSLTRDISLNTGVRPTASALSVAISGNGRDKTIDRYVQSITRVQASFTRTAGFGATVSSSNIVVRRQSGGNNSQTISGNSGTTANPVTLSGVYEIIATVTDSRGRTHSVSTTVTVQAYSAPIISNFTAGRRASPTTTVDNGITTTWSPIGTLNPATVQVVRTLRNGTSPSTMYTLSNDTAGILNTTRTYTSQSDALTYVYTITVTDSFGKRATAAVTVGTSFIEMTIAKGRGIGVGKVWERGALDVAGNVFIRGNATITDANGSNVAIFDGSVTTTNNIRFWRTLSFEMSGMADAIDMKNHNIVGVNSLLFADPGVGEGIEWVGGNGWEIFESPNGLTNSSGNLQFTTKDANGVRTRRATFTTGGHLDIPGSLLLGTSSSNTDGAMFYNGTNVRMRTGGTWDTVASEAYVRSKMATGRTTVTGTSGGGVTSQTISFGKTFSSAPNVVACADSTVPGTVVEITVGSVTTTNFIVYVNRTNSTNTTVQWIAIMD